MAWSKPQQIAFFTACTLAEVDPRGRYTILAFVGCKLAVRKAGEVPRVSASDHANTNSQFECAMATVELIASAIGHTIRPPRDHKSWHEAAVGGTGLRIAHRVKAVMEELHRKVPSYDWGKQLGSLIDINRKKAEREGLVPPVAWAEVPSIGTLDPQSQLNVLRGLEAIGRKELAKRGLRAQFDQDNRRSSRRSRRAS